MKKSFITLTLLLLITAPSFTIYSQTKDSSIVTTDETVSFLLSRNKEYKALISEQENRIADLQSELDVEKENSASIGVSYESAKSEIVSLKSSNAALGRAVAINEDTISKLQTENAKQKEKAKNAEKTKWKVIAVAAGIVALKFILP